MMTEYEVVTNVVGAATLILIAGFVFQEYVRQMMKGEV